MECEIDELTKRYLVSLASCSTNRIIFANVAVCSKELGQTFPSGSCSRCSSTDCAVTYSKKKVIIVCRLCNSNIKSVKIKKSSSKGEKMKIIDKPHQPIISAVKPAPSLVSKTTVKSKNRASKLRKLAGLDEEKGSVTSNSSLLSFVNSLR
ncbi:unnamed protein product [Bursaphelenchus okinawaensis]|uniref:Uncharacterized protein n=1 Tax=Bursaphelenchus okinawaensis TaxID=465554 RepID=A0A811LL47_9BILA|nr:unnamed protein product [Bursaphelenchus okinawaensis]CAG9125396.1 unnamed protein product [Bursaphelenchus okinawaensis]